MSKRNDENAPRKGGFFRRRFVPENDIGDDISSGFDFEDEGEKVSSFASAFSDYDPSLSLSDDIPGDAGPEAPATDVPETDGPSPVEAVGEPVTEEEEPVAEEKEPVAEEKEVGPEEEEPEEEMVFEDVSVSEFLMPDDVEDTSEEDAFHGENAETPEAAEFEANEIPGESSTGPMGSTDMNLRIAFGLEEDEDDDRDRVRKFGDQIESDVRKSRPVKLSCPEFTDPVQAKGIAAAYKRSARFYNLRLAAAAVLSFVLLIYENIPAISTLFTGRAKQLSGAFDPAVFPVVYTMVSLQILFIVCAVGFRELKAGVRAIFVGAPDALSLTVFPVLACTVHSIVTSFAAASRFEPVLFNSAAALAVTLAIFSARLNNKREMMTFFVAGSKREKYAMCRLSEEELLEQGVSFYGDEDETGDFMKIEKIRFVDSFFGRTQAPDGTRRVFIISVIGIAFVLALLSASYHFAKSGRANEALTLGILIAVTLIPMSAYITYSYPFYRAAKAAKSVDSAIIGDVSLDEYAGASVVAFDDTNLFPSVGVKVQNIRIYNNARIDRVLYYAASAFSRAGGPLDDIFEIATMDMSKSDSVEILDAARGFLSTKIDGVSIVFGSYEELRKRGADIDEEYAVDDVDLSDEMSIMYMLREGKLVSKLYIKYDLDTDIEPILKQFNDSGIYMCIRTYDPNINEEMIASKVEMRDPPVKVVRFREEGEVGAVEERADSGIVTTGSPKALLQLIPYCDNTSRTKRDCMALGIVSSVISAIIVLLIFVSGGISKVNSLLAAVYQLAWLLPAFLISKIFIR